MNTKEALIDFPALCLLAARGQFKFHAPPRLHTRTNGSGEVARGMGFPNCFLQDFPGLLFHRATMPLGPRAKVVRETIVKISYGDASHCPTPDVCGGARRDRTADLNTASVALSQLSYGPTMKCGF